MASPIENLSIRRTKPEQKETKREKMLRNLQLNSTNRSILHPSLSSFYPLLLLLLLSLSRHAHSSKTHTFIYAGCSQEKYQPSTPFEANFNSFMSSVVSSSSQAIYNSFSIGNGTSTDSEASIYGLYQCRGDLDTVDCSKCIGNVVNQVVLVCPYSYGGALQLEGCFVRYEHIDFLGKLDTSLRYKKCSKSVSGDVEFFRRRDDVLADIETGRGFRISSSGLVQGYGQCLGDMSESDCSSCLADAVGKCKSLCGSAAAADVFLGQCYARYRASGYYDSSSDSSEDQVGKTVAIIVGVVAALAVLVVLLSICRRAMG